MPSASSSVRLVCSTSVLLSATSMTWALSVGTVNDQTVLGSPLRVSVPVLGAEGDRRLPASDCVKARVQAGDNLVPPKSVRTRVERAQGDASYRVHITTDIGIIEPVVTVSLSVGCDSSVSRQFVLFIDPPGLAPTVPAINPAVASNGASTSPVRSSSVFASTASVPTAPSSASSSARAGGAKASARSAGQPGASRGQSTGSAVRTPTPRVPPKVTAAAKSTPPLRSGPRLSLEPPMATPGTPGGIAQDPSAEAVAWANQVTLLNQLEEMLKQVTSESQAVQANMAGLQAKLRSTEDALKAERDQYRAQQHQQPRLVWLLAATVGLLTMALGAVLWRQRRRPTPFFQQSGGFQEPLPSKRAVGSQPLVLDSMPSRLGDSGPVLLDMPPVVTAKTLTTSVEPAPLQAPAKEWAVAEVVDLEQEADFFIALGQDQAAIDLLNGHMSSAGGHSPLPYLKLLDIHRRRGERMPYEQLRLRFHRRFNARIPEWNSPAPTGSQRGLEDHLDIQQSLEAHWVSPPSAVKLLESLLHRHDGQSVTFDLGAYRDLLMLHAVARDLSTPGTEAGHVDLELPLSTV